MFRPDIIDTIKWLRDYFDFCRKYNFGEKEPESLAACMDKLKDKGQAENLRKQAQHAVSLFFELAHDSSGKIQDVVPHVKNTLSEQAATTIDAIYWHTKESLPNQGVSSAHAHIDPHAAVQNSARLVPNKRFSRICG